jgi:hypothetical protein
MNRSAPLKQDSDFVQHTSSAIGSGSIDAAEKPEGRAIEQQGRSLFTNCVEAQAGRSE